MQVHSGGKNCHRKGQILVAHENGKILACTFDVNFPISLVIGILELHLLVPRSPQQFAESQPGGKTHLDTLQNRQWQLQVELEV